MNDYFCEKKIPVPILIWSLFEYNDFSKQYQFQQQKAQKDFKRHKKSKSEPPLKFPLNYKQKPCIEFCLEAKIFGCELQLHSKNSSVLLVLNAVTVMGLPHFYTSDWRSSFWVISVTRLLSVNRHTTCDIRITVITSRSRSLFETFTCPFF